MKNEIQNATILTEDPQLLATIAFLLWRCGPVYIAPDASIHGTERSARDDFTEAHISFTGDMFYSAEGLYPLALAQGVSYDAGTFLLNDVPVLKFDAPKEDIACINESFYKHLYFRMTTEHVEISKSFHLWFKTFRNISYPHDYGYMSLCREESIEKLVKERKRVLDHLTRDNLNVLRRKGSSDAEAVIRKANAVLMCSRIQRRGDSYLVSHQDCDDYEVSKDKLIKLGFDLH